MRECQVETLCSLGGVKILAERTCDGYALWLHPNQHELRWRRRHFAEHK
jgi:hypothetical protein